MSSAQLFLLCALITVVVHSFVADSSLLDCCDLVVVFVVVVVVVVCVSVCVCVCVCVCARFFHLMLAGR